MMPTGRQKLRRSSCFPQDMTGMSLVDRCRPPIEKITGAKCPGGVQWWQGTTNNNRVAGSPICTCGEPITKTVMGPVPPACTMLNDGDFICISVHDLSSE